MNKIIFPLKLRMQGPAVGDLEDALKLLLKNSKERWALQTSVAQAEHYVVPQSDKVLKMDISHHTKGTR